MHALALAACCAVLTVGTAIPSSAQRNVPDLQLSQFVHRSWTKSDGLPQNSVSAIATTPDGYLWVGTQGGLGRFDGTRFHSYDRSNGLLNNEIRALLAEADGVLWIGTYGGGLSRFEGQDVRTYTSEDGLPSDLIRALHRDSQGRLWIGTINGGAAIYVDGTFQAFSMEEGLAGNVVLSFAETDDGAVWVGTNQGLTRFHAGHVTTLSSDDGLPADIIWSLETDLEGRLWIGTDAGLAILDEGRIEPQTGLNTMCRGPIGSLLLGPDGAMWIGTMGSGLCRAASNQYERISVDGGLTDSRVRSLAFDQEGSLWIGTESGGLNQLIRGKFVHISASEGLPDNMVFTVLEDQSARLWIGTKGHGLSRLDSGRPVSISGLPSEHIYALDTASDGSVWAGFEGGGVCKLDAGAVQCYGEQEGLPSKNVFAIVETRVGDLRVGTEEGLATLRDGKIETDPRLAAAVTVIHEDRSGRIWVGRYGGGMSWINGSEVRTLGGDEGLPNETIFAIAEDPEGLLWLGTHGGGLCRLLDDQADCLTTDEGLPSDNILQVVLDDRGSIWLGTVEGIVQLSRDSALKVLAGEEVGLTSRLYTAADGLKSTEVNGGTQPSAWKSRDGRLWFATNHGVAWIDPANIRTNPIAPAVHIEAIDANGNPVADIHGARLPAGTRDLHIAYTGISFTAPEEVHFKYKLEGYDADWVDAGNRREAYYTNLAPGEYTFRVIAANNDGVWNEEGASVSFYLEPYFYQTWWFAVLCLFAAIGLTILTYKARIRQLRARERELERTVDARTHDLRLEKERTEEAKKVIEGQADQLRDLNQDLEEQADQLRDLNDHLEAKVKEQFDLLVKERERYEADLIDAKDRAEASDRLKSAILNNLSHEFRTPLTAILGFTEIISMEAPDDLKEFTVEIDRGGKRLLRTLDALLEFSRLEANESGLKTESVDLSTAAMGVVRDLKKVAERKNISLTYKPAAPVRILADAPALEEIIWNLVDNGIKFTREGEVEVTVGSDADHAYISVRDTGVGIGEHFRERMYEAFAQESDGFDRSFEGVGLGLTITRRLVEHMHGAIEVETAVDQGSTFTVTFPLKRAVAGVV